jgi:hypothetical protein
MAQSGTVLVLELHCEMFSAITVPRVALDVPAVALGAVHETLCYGALEGPGL